MIIEHLTERQETNEHYCMRTLACRTDDQRIGANTGLVLQTGSDHLLLFPCKSCEAQMFKFFASDMIQAVAKDAVKKYLKNRGNDA